MDLRPVALQKARELLDDPGVLAYIGFSTNTFCSQRQPTSTMQLPVNNTTPSHKQILNETQKTHLSNREHNPNQIQTNPYTQNKSRKETQTKLTSQEEEQGVTG